MSCCALLCLHVDGSLSLYTTTDEYLALAFGAMAVVLARIDLKVDDNAMAWLYNLLASLFSDTIREYITRTVLDTLEDNILDLLDVLNDFAK